MDYKISVIVPIYNVEDYICECLESIINQEYRNLDIILVDDGSTDSSGAICDEYGAMDNRVRVIHKENGGLVSARKAGVDIAIGDYITFVDGDDWLDLNAYKTILAKVYPYNPDMIAYGNKKNHDGNVIVRYENLKEGYYTKKSIIDIMEDYYNDNEIALDHIILSNLINKLFKPEILKKYINKVDNRITNGEGIATIVPIFMDVESIYIVEEATYNYRIRSNSIMHTEQHKDAQSSTLVIKRLINCLSEKKLNNNYWRKMVLSYAYCTALLSDINYFFNAISDIYKVIEKKSKILIYGKGVYGLNVKELIETENYHSVSGMIDKASINEIDNYEYDYIIIAITNGSFVRDAIKCLKEKSISVDKIVYLKNSDLNDKFYIK